VNPYSASAAGEREGSAMIKRKEHKMDMSKYLYLEDDVFIIFSPPLS